MGDATQIMKSTGSISIRVWAVHGLLFSDIHTISPWQKFKWILPREVINKKEKLRHFPLRGGGLACYEYFLTLSPIGKKGFRKGWFECGVYRIILPNDHAIFCVTLTRSSQSRQNFQIDFVFLPEHIQLWACGSIRDLDKGIVGHGRKRQNPKFENTNWSQDLNSQMY